MSEVTLNILDTQGAIHGSIQGSTAECFIAGLSAEPESIIELQDAVARFVKPVKGLPILAGFSEGVSEKRGGLGILFVDLAARTVGAEWSYSTVNHHGWVHYQDGVKSSNIRLQYCIPNDWLFLDSVMEYKQVCSRRRAKFAAHPRIDARPVLFGSISRFVVEHCLIARDSKVEDAIQEIHSRWLLTPREDLQGRTPREVLLSKCEFIDLDLQSRELQWGRVGEPAPCLSRDSAAYRFAGFGTHSVVVYYDFVRSLVSDCWNHVSGSGRIDLADEVARLDRVAAKWLGCPDPDFGQRTPAFVLECERERLPLLVSEEEAVLDDDCPACQAMSKLGPAFWHLDGCNMDDGFPFSFCLTHDEWEEDERRRKEFDEEFNRRWEQRNHGEQGQL